MAQLGLSGIGHVALKVADIERSLQFYRDTMGFAEMMRLNRDDGALWLIYLRITDTQFLELFPEWRGTSARRMRAATAINHFCLECADLEATAAALCARGHHADRRAQDRGRQQPPMLDRGSRRQPHRIHADGAELDAGRGNCPPSRCGVSDFARR